MTDGKIDIPDGARDAAIDRWLRHNEGPLSKEERADFATWLSEDQRHASAFEKISGIGGLLATQLPGVRPRRNSRRRLKKAATAISLGAIAFFLFLDDIALYLRADYFTGSALSLTTGRASDSTQSRLLSCIMRRIVEEWFFSPERRFLRRRLILQVPLSSKPPAAPSPRLARRSTPPSKVRARMWRSRSITSRSRAAAGK